MQRDLSPYLSVLASTAVLLATLGAGLPARYLAAQNQPADGPVEVQPVGDSGGGTNQFQWSWEIEEGAPPTPDTRRGVGVDAYGKLLKESLDLRRKLEEAMKQQDALKRENARLLVQVEDLEQKRESLAATIKNLKAPADLESEVKKAQAEKARIEAELAQVRKALEDQVALQSTSGNTNLPAAPAPQAGSDLFRKIERENALLRSQLVRIQEAERQLSQAKEDMAGKDSRLAVEISRMSAEKAQLERRIEELQAAQKKERRLLREVAVKGNQYKSEARRLKAQLDKVQDDLDRSERAVQALKALVQKQGIAAAALPAPAGPPSGNVASAEYAAKKDALFEKAVALTLSGKYETAEKAYLVVLQMDPLHAAARYNLGSLYADHLDNPKKAIAQYKAYLELSPGANDADIVRSWIVELEMQASRR